MRYIYVILGLMLTLQAEAVVRRVKISVYSGDGSSWSQAINSLQSALNASQPGDEVWVGQGIWTPNSGTQFTVKEGVKVYGGFSATNNSVGFNDRNWLLYPTILASGSTSSNRISNVSINGNNNLSQQTLLEGFKILNGYSSNGGGVSIGGIPAFKPILRNLYFDNCTATGYGGAMIIYDAAPTLENVVFKSCESVYQGGAIYIDNGTGIFNNVVFSLNTANTDGGAVCSAYTGNAAFQPVFNNVIFYRNFNQGGAGGAVFAELSSPIFNNCTFVDNHSVLDAGGAVHTFSPSGTSSQPSSTFVNCLFWNNTKISRTNPVLSDIGVLRASSSASYSYFKETSTFSGIGNITTNSINPFVTPDNPIGNDNIWMTSDDGLIPSLCVGIVDKGNNNAITLDKDAAGFPRKTDVNLITDGGLGNAPIVDIGAYENQTTTTTLQLTGSIGNEHTIPTPQELTSDTITNITAPASGTTIRWEKFENGSWVNTTPASTSNFYKIPTLTTTIQFRRVVSSTNYCNTSFYSNPVTIKVVQSNGNVKGKVFSNNSTTGVQGITIKVVRTTNVSGSPANYTYQTVTGVDGTYEFTTNPIYYGDNTVNTTNATFTVTASKQGHSFEVPTLSKTLGTTSPTATEVNFKDLTTYSIAGKTYQTYPVTGTAAQSCRISNVQILKNGTYVTQSAASGSNLGTYGVTVTDPGNITLAASYNGHVFTPPSITENVNSDVVGKDFKDITTHTITGSITAGIGCSNTSGNSITGTALLRFFSKTENGDTCFIIEKSIVASDNGSFSITLPARKYFVKLIDFSPRSGGDVSADSVINFINTLHIDSLTRDITTHDTTLNLVYVRAPVITITGLNTVCNTLPTPFAIIPQAVADSFYVLITQGKPSYGCPVKGSKDSFSVRTNVHQEDALETFKFPVDANGRKVKLVGGIPNITPNDYLKDIFINFTDTFSRNAVQFKRKVLVTGTKTDPGTYTTVSPQVPLLVLHDPPGDQSYSSWESNKTVESAIRFYSGSNLAAGGWLEAKIGTKFQAGIGISTETSIWGSINASISTNVKNTTSGEAILSTKTSQSFSTANNNAITGAQGDVYIGAALNLKYATATDISFSNCTITSTRKLAVANDGFATQYIYTESHIRNTIIPQLLMFISLTTNPNTIAGYMNQIKVWQQVLDNNTANKSRAAFVENHSFNGAAGPYTNTTTTSSTKSSTVEFNMDIETSVAVALGLEIAGSGISGGASVAFKMENGKSETNTITNETSISYTLDDDDDADFFSVDVKKDPVYNTPVFELAAGTASCPAEDGAQPRSDIFFTTTNPVVQNVPAATEATFRLKVVNTSPSHEPRNYFLSYDQGSNVDNETIKIAGSAYVLPVNLGTINYLDSSVKTVSLSRSPGSEVYSYEGVKFNVTDACGDVSKSVIVTAQFVAPCSNISFTLPADNWLITSAQNNKITVKAGSYTLANLNSVILEYSKTGTSNWSQGPLLNSAQLTNGFDWDVTTLEDGAYNIRFKLSCNNGTVYSQRVSGIIDRKAPTLFGRPEPTDDNYVTGDIISFNYNKKIATTIDTAWISMKRLSDSTSIPFSVNSYENKMIIVPDVNIAAFTGDSVMVVVKRMDDQNGNKRTIRDTLRFLIGISPLATGNNVITMAVANPVVYKNTDSTINFLFKLPVNINATDSMRVNYTISGTARLGIDYRIQYPSYQPGYTFFNGAQGAIRLPKGSNQTMLQIVPIGDSLLTPNKTIKISLSEGGNYGLGTTSSAIGTITSEDGIYQYTFIGDGYFSDKTQWLNNRKPLTTLAPGKTVFINPSGTCTLNSLFTLKPTSTLRVIAGKEFIISKIP